MGKREQAPLHSIEVSVSPATRAGLNPNVFLAKERVGGMALEILHSLLLLPPECRALSNLGAETILFKRVFETRRL